MSPISCNASHTYHHYTESYTNIIELGPLFIFKHGTYIDTQ